MDYAAAFHAVTSDPRYLRNLDWGEPRRGHPEGTVRAHIAELERNLKRLRRRLSAEDYDKLLLLAHVHDTFKAEAKSGVPILDPRSHASLARDFLAEFCDDADLLAMVQYHDEPFALWQQVRNKGAYNPRPAGSADRRDRGLESVSGVPDHRRLHVGEEPGAAAVVLRRSGRDGDDGDFGGGDSRIAGSEAGEFPGDGCSDGHCRLLECGRG